MTLNVQSFENEWRLFRYIGVPLKFQYRAGYGYNYNSYGVPTIEADTAGRNARICSAAQNTHRSGTRTLGATRVHRVDQARQAALDLSPGQRAHQLVFAAARRYADQRVDDTRLHADPGKTAGVLAVVHGHSASVRQLPRGPGSRTDVSAQAFDGYATSRVLSGSIVYAPTPYFALNLTAQYTNQSPASVPICGRCATIPVQCRHARAHQPASFGRYRAFVLFQLVERTLVAAVYDSVLAMIPMKLKTLASLILVTALASAAAVAQTPPAPIAAPTAPPTAAPAAPTPPSNLVTFTGQLLDYRNNFVYFTTGDAFPAVEAPRIIDALTGQPTSVAPRAKMFAQATFDPATKKIIQLAITTKRLQASETLGAASGVRGRRLVAGTGAGDRRAEPHREEVAVAFEVTVPPTTTFTDQIYISTDSSDWNPTAIKLDRVDAYKYRALRYFASGTKFAWRVTRGTWNSVERGQDNLDSPPHQFFVREVDSLVASTTVYHWSDERGNSQGVGPQSLPTPYNPSPFGCSARRHLRPAVKCSADSRTRPLSARAGARRRTCAPHALAARGGREAGRRDRRRQRALLQRVALDRGAQRRHRPSRQRHRHHRRRGLHRLARGSRGHRRQRADRARCDDAACRRVGARFSGPPDRRLAHRHRDRARRCDARAPRSRAPRTAARSCFRSSSTTRRTSAARHAEIVSRTSVRFRPAAFPTSTGAPPVPMYLYTFAIGNGYAATALSPAAFDQPYGLFSTPNSFTALHLRYLNGIGGALGLEQNLIGNNDGYLATAVDAPLHAAVERSGKRLPASRSQRNHHARARSSTTATTRRRSVSRKRSGFW